MPGSANNPLGLPYPISKTTSQTYNITPVFQIKTLEFRKIMQFAKVQRASSNKIGIQIIPLIPNHEVMHKETESDKYFNNSKNRNGQHTARIKTDYSQLKGWWNMCKTMINGLYPIDRGSRTWEVLVGAS